MGETGRGVQCEELIGELVAGGQPQLELVEGPGLETWAGGERPPSGLQSCECAWLEGNVCEWNRRDSKRPPALMA